MKRDRFLCALCVQRRLAGGTESSDARHWLAGTARSVSYEQQALVWMKTSEREVGMPRVLFCGILVAVVSASIARTAAVPDTVQGTPTVAPPQCLHGSDEDP